MRATLAPCLLFAALIAPPASAVGPAPGRPPPPRMEEPAAHAADSSFVQGFLRALQRLRLHPGRDDFDHTTSLFHRPTGSRR